MAASAWLKNLRALLRRAPVVNVVRLDGVIGSGGRFNKGLSLESMAGPIEEAFEGGKRLKAVALVVNSPGGSPAQSALIHDRIRALAEEKKVPVYAFVEDAAASGGYWLACAGEEIHAQASSIVGSIGVVSAGFGFVEAIAKLGVERRIYTAGENKAILDPFQPEKEDDVERLKTIQLELHRVFIDHVKARRGPRLNDIDGDLFTGAFWLGEEARRRGLIDGLGDVRTVMRAKFGKNVKIRGVAAKRGLLAKLGLGARIAAGIADEIETRAVWGRLGL